MPHSLPAYHLQSVLMLSSFCAPSCAPISMPRGQPLLSLPDAEAAWVTILQWTVHGFLLFHVSISMPMMGLVNVVHLYCVIGGSNLGAPDQEMEEAATAAARDKAAAADAEEEARAGAAGEVTHSL